MRGLPPPVAEAVKAASAGAEEVLLVRPEPMPAVLRRRQGSISTVQATELQSRAGSLDCVVDAGRLSQVGLLMDLGRCRWDVLGRVEEVLRAIADLLALLRPGGRLLVYVTGDPSDYLAGYLSAFLVELRELSTGLADGSLLCEVTAARPVGPADLEAVLSREVLEERSHKRYADALDAAVIGKDLQILDVGGGDGHMAEWWAASGHSISLLEVDAEQVRLAKARLGEERVTMHDGVSPWPYADNSFDACLLLHVLHHILPEEALQLTLSEAARVCRSQVLVMEDQPRAAASNGRCRLAVAVTANHFRPFKQDPNIFMRNIRPDDAWRALFAGAGLQLAGVKLIPGTLQHPVPHTLYDLRPHK